MRKESDLTAAILSSLAVIIQLLLFILTTISNSIGILEVFAQKDLIPFVTLLSIFLSLTAAGTYSFFHKNKELYGLQNILRPVKWLKEKFYSYVRPFPSSWEFEKKVLGITFIGLILSSIVFILSTISYLSFSNILFINQGNVSVWQTVSYLLLWTLTSLTLFVWIVNEREKAEEFREEHFMKNLYESLREQGYLSVNVKGIETRKDDYLSGKFLVARFGTGSKRDKYLQVSYDGKRVIKEFYNLREYAKATRPITAAASLSASLSATPQKSG